MNVREAISLVLLKQRFLNNLYSNYKTEYRHRSIFCNKLKCIDKKLNETIYEKSF